MFEIRSATTDEERWRFCAVPGSTATAALLVRQCPDALWCALDRGEMVARCALWWRQTPPHGDHRLGLVGHYHARAAEAGLALLQRALEELAARGCTLAVGPMDGNTWQPYRFVTERGNEPPFFLEPDHPDDWPGHFTSAGFTPLARYCSAVVDDLPATSDDAAALADRLRGRGIGLRTLRTECLEDELRRLYALSHASFAGNFLYTPLPEEDFAEQYRKLIPLIVPELVLLAERHGEPIGFLFALPDLLQQQRGLAVDTVVAKTMATHPAARGLGVGALLMARCHETARRLGFRRVIHALMHEDNHSLRISRHTARVFRRYTLFARALAGPT